MSRLAAVLEAGLIPDAEESIAVKWAEIRSLHAYMARIIEATEQDDADSSPVEEEHEGYVGGVEGSVRGHLFR
jgi:hypothetical protein